MTATDARALLAHIGERQPKPEDVVFLDMVRTRVARGADLNAKQAAWLKRIAVEIESEAVSQ